MYTLLPVDKIDRTTIADGDKLNNCITALSTNDSNMLSDVNDIYDKATDCKAFIEQNIENWENSAVKNFSAVNVKEDTIFGKSLLSSELTLTSDGSVQFVNNANDTYSISIPLATDSRAVSSYFIEASHTRDTLFPSEFVVLRSQWVKGVVGSTTVYGNFVDGVNGLLFDANMRYTRITDRLMSNTASYLYPCSKFVWEGDDPPEQDYAKSYAPTNGSIIWSTDQRFYGESMSADMFSIALYTKASAYNSSIAMKGGVAINSSFAMGHAINGNTAEVLEASAMNNSIAIYAAYAKDNSVCMTSEIVSKNYNLVSAVDNSILLLHTAMEANEKIEFANNAFGIFCKTTDSDNIVVSNNSYLLLTDELDNLYADNKSLMLSIAHAPDNYQTKTSVTADNSYLIHYAKTSSQSYVNSLCMSMANCGSENSTTTQYNVVNSVIVAADTLDSSDIVNSLLLATHNSETPIENVQTHDTINIASQLSTSTEAKCRLLLPALSISEKDTVSIANNMSVNEVSGTSASLFVANDILQFAGSCTGNAVVASKDSDVYNANDCVGLLNVKLSASSAYGCTDCVVSQQSAVAIMCASAISPDHIVEQSLAIEGASTSADKSVSLFNTNIDKLNSNYSSCVPYAFAMFGGKPTYADSHNTVVDNRLSFWADELRKRDLPITQFKKISTITDVSELENDVAYIITG